MYTYNILIDELVAEKMGGMEAGKAARVWVKIGGPLILTQSSLAHLAGDFRAHLGSSQLISSSITTSSFWDGRSVCVNV